MKRVKIEAFQCENCGKIHNLEYSAIICCKQYHCEKCGVETESYRILCDNCSEKQKYEEAIKFTYEEYIKNYPEHMLFHGDNYYLDMESIIDDLDISESIPDYVWGTRREEITVDIESALSDAEENSGLEEFEFNNKNELIEYVEKWNEKNKDNAYFRDYKVAVIVPEKYKNIKE
jgi:hypothetical protein